MTRDTFLQLVAVMLVALAGGCSASSSESPGSERAAATRVASYGTGSYALDAPLGDEDVVSAVSPRVWVQHQKVIASDGAWYLAFGRSVVVSGDTAIISSDVDDDLGSSSGSAYVLVWSGASWTEQQKLVASDGAAGDHFGFSVALSGDTALIGANQDDSRRGAAYVFVRSGTTWTEQQKLVASNRSENDGFGASVAISGDTALVGASGDNSGAFLGGSAHVFVRSGATWTEQQELVASDSSTGDAFGTTVSLSGDTALFGVSSDSDRGSGSGSAYVFTRSGTSWTERQKLLASDGTMDDRFGVSVVVLGDTALVGAQGDDGSRGSLYVFSRSGTSFAELQKLTASDGVGADSFGGSVSLSNDAALVGANGDEAGYGAGYVFRRSGTSWTEQQKLVAKDEGSGEGFGMAVSISGDLALFGAWADEAVRGAAYSFHFGEDYGGPCTVASDCGSLRCADDRCCDTACDGPCDVCSVAAGAASDGVCGLLPAGSTGSPACAVPLGCTGASAQCSACASDGECAASDYCDAEGACQASKARGAACDLATGGDCSQASCRACASGLFCVDGFCCESDCVGKCEACSRALTGAANGTCTPIPGDEDPEGECGYDSRYPCDEDGACDGERACRRYARRGTQCGETTCTSDTVSGQVCNGSGTCEMGSVPCAPYTCSGDACRTSCTTDAECDSTTAFCTPGGSCAPRKGLGEVCEVGSECASSFCIDGVCCDDECAGQCEACGEPESMGECSPVEGEPRGEREACAGAEDCAGSCDGQDGSSCAYPGESIECGSVCEDGRETVSRCNGAGECAAGRPVSCGIYACGADRCLTSCAESSECAPGQRCENEICIPSNARCSEDLGESRPVNADAIACAPYRCDPATGACRATCNVSSECASGHACNPGTKSCERVSTPDSDEDGGCGCRTSPSASSNAWSGSALLVFLLALIRRVPRGGRGVSDYPLRCAHRTPPLDGSPRRRTRARARARAGD